MKQIKQLFIGGARSGKSRLAQEYALDWQRRTQGEVIVVATAENIEDTVNGTIDNTAGDETIDSTAGSSMSRRIAHHKANRPTNWTLIESALNLTDVISQTSRLDNLILVDCLTLWLSNNLLSQQNWQQAKQELLDVLVDAPGEVVLISNEVGQGVVPLGELSRQFVDESGWLHQSLAKQLDKVTLVIAGLPLVLKMSR